MIDYEWVATLYGNAHLNVDPVGLRTVCGLRLADMEPTPYRADRCKQCVSALRAWVEKVLAPPETVKAETVTVRILCKQEGVDAKQMVYNALNRKHAGLVSFQFVEGTEPEPEVVARCICGWSAYRHENLLKHLLSVKDRSKHQEDTELKPKSVARCACGLWFTSHIGLDAHILKGGWGCREYIPSDKESADQPSE